MKEIIEKLWNEYLMEECAESISSEENELWEQNGKFRETLYTMLPDEQKVNIDNYIEAFCNIQEKCIKKAFFMGCKFTLSFVSEVEILTK